MIDRPLFLRALIGGLLAAPLAAVAQPVGKVHDVGYLSGSSRQSSKRLRHRDIASQRMTPALRGCARIPGTTPSPQDGLGSLNKGRTS